MKKLLQDFEASLKDPATCAEVDKWAKANPAKYQQFIDDMKRRDCDQLKPVFNGDEEGRDAAEFGEASEFDVAKFEKAVGASDAPEERGDPQLGFEDAADDMGNLFFWLLTGKKKGSKETLTLIHGGKLNYSERDLRRSLEDPAIIGRRLLAVIYNLRPDLLEGRSLEKLADAGGTTRQNFSNHLLSFFNNFPVFKNRICHGKQDRKHQAIKKARNG